MSKAIVIATWVTTTDDREVLRLAVGDGENRAFFDGRLASPATPTRDSKAQSERFCSGAAWQRCRVHVLHNVLARVPTARPRSSSGSSANRAAVIRLVGMILAEQDDAWQDGRRYFRPETTTVIDAVPIEAEGQPLLLAS
ncbi:MAG TPA: hypothetical protein VNJ28_04970 [Candidatus Limnocylindrales bacterium]|nr:hypothetical protein [Candidatus Limnocylindrales bacterium]